MAIKQNLSPTGQGETFTLNCTFKSAIGVPVDLSENDISLVLRQGNKDGPLIGEYPAVSDDQGNITIKVSDEVTALWPEGNTAYIIINNYPNGDKKYMAYGAMTVMSVIPLG